MFPEQFPTFRGPPGPQRDMFVKLHPDLAQPAFWRSQQERLKAGIQEDLFAYSEKRFTNRYGGNTRPAPRRPHAPERGMIGADGRRRAVGIFPSRGRCRRPAGMSAAAKVSLAGHRACAA